MKRSRLLSGAVSFLLLLTLAAPALARVAGPVLTGCTPVDTATDVAPTIDEVRMDIADPGPFVVDPSGVILANLNDETTVEYQIATDATGLHLYDLALQPATEYRLTVQAGALLGDQGRSNASEMTCTFTTASVEGVRLTGSVLYEGVLAEAVTLTVTDAHGIDWTASVGHPATTDVGTFKVETVKDGELRYTAEFPPGDYNLTAYIGDETKSAGVTLSVDSGVLHQEETGWWVFQDGPTLSNVASFALVGSIDIGMREQEGLTLQLYKNGALVGESVYHERNQGLLRVGAAVEDAFYIGNGQPDTSCHVSFGLSMGPDLQSVGDPAPDRTCVLYFASVPRGIYTVVATLGDQVGQATGDTANAESAFPFGASVLMPTITLATRVEREPVAPKPAPLPEKPKPTPPTVTLKALPTTTGASFVLATGTATPGAAVRVSVGGHEASTYLVGEAGTFSILARLAAGSNEITATATKEGVSTSASATVTRDAEGPTLAIEAPAKIDQESVTVTVKSEPGVTVKSGSRSLGTTDAQGALSADLKLSVGTHELSFTGVDAYGNEGPVATAKIERTAPRPAATDLAGHWAEGAVKGLLDLGAITLDRDGAFQPEQEINRAQFAAWLAGALKLPAASEEPALTDRASIPAEAKAGVAAAVHAHLMNGNANGAFEPAGQLTRLQAAVIIGRALRQAGLTVTPAPLTFADLDQIPAWAHADLALAVGSGQVSGYPDQTFRPAQVLTRAEAASLLFRMVNRIAGK